MAGSLDTSGKRFSWFITENYGSVPQYTDRFKMNKSQVYRVVNDTASPKLETCAEYAITGLNLHWLTVGEGPWWAPNEMGRTLARKKGIVVEDQIGHQDASATDYLELVHDVFEFAEESIRERLATSNLDPQERIGQADRPGTKPGKGREKG